MRNHQIKLEDFKDQEFRTQLASSGRKRLTAVASFHGEYGPGTVTVFEVQCDGCVELHHSIAKAIEAYNQAEDEVSA